MRSRRRSFGRCDRCLRRGLNNHSPNSGLPRDVEVKDLDQKIIRAIKLDINLVLSVSIVVGDGRANKSPSDRPFTDTFKVEYLGRFLVEKEFFTFH